MCGKYYPFAIKSQRILPAKGGQFSMIEVREMSDKGIEELLSRVGYGHLACCLDDKPYLVPIHYAYDGTNVYIYTTEGKKSEIIERNPNICLQVEDVRTNR